MDLELLTPERIAEWNNVLELPGEAVRALQDMAVEINADPALLEIFTCAHVETALEGKWHTDWSPLPVDPQVQERFQERASLLYLLAYLAALPTTARRYHELGISQEIFKHTLSDVNFHMSDYHDLHGVWGYSLFAWIWLHLDCRLFRLGRLQYRAMPFPGGITAFRHRATGRILLLADPEMPLRQDGYALGAFRPEPADEGNAANGGPAQPRAGSRFSRPLYIKKDPCQHAGSSTRSCRRLRIKMLNKESNYGK